MASTGPLTCPDCQGRLAPHCKQPTASPCMWLRCQWCNSFGYPHNVWYSTARKRADNRAKAG